MTNESCQKTCANWLLRAVLAICFINASLMKLTMFTVDGFAATMNLPVFIAWLVVLGELGSGIGILVGGFLKNDLGNILTRISGGILALIMLGAIVLFKLNGFVDEAGALTIYAGIANIYADLALFAIAMKYLLTGNCCSSK